MRSRLNIFAVAAASVSTVAIAVILIASFGSTTCANAQGNACVAACRAAHSDCRIRSKGSPSCDAQLQACLQGCLKR